MPILGRYEVVQELYATPSGSVSCAKLVDGRQPSFVVKIFQPAGVEDDELHFERQTFQERVRTQQQVSTSAPDAHWAVIRHHGTTPGGAYYVTDFFPLTVQQLVERRTPIPEEALYRIVDGINRGLAEPRATAQRPHGNLKPENVLLATKDKGLTDVRVALTDPASAAAAAKTGQTEDRRALGDLIHRLVLHGPYPGGPLEDSPKWSALGHQGAQWRAFCDAMLADEDEAATNWQQIAQSIAALEPSRRSRKTASPPARASVKPPRPPGSRRRLKRVVMTLIIGLLLSGAALALFGMRLAREFCRQKSAWLGQLAEATSDPVRRQKWEQEASLKQAIADIDRAAPRSIKCEVPLWSVDPRHILQTREALAAAQRVRLDLSPERWKRLGTMWEQARQFEVRGWVQPADFLGRKIAAVGPAAGNDLAGNIDRLLAVDVGLGHDLSKLDPDWKRLADRVHEMEGANDATLASFAAFLQSSAGSALRLGDSGFTGGDRIATCLALMDKLEEARRTVYPSKTDLARFNADVVSKIDLQHLQESDLRRWLERLPDYVLQNDAVASATASLRTRLGAISDDFEQSHPDATERQSFTQDHQKVQADVDSFAQGRFIGRDLSDGVFSTQQTKLESEIDGLRGYLHRRNPEEWIKSLPTLTTNSDVINGWWEDWKHVLQTSSSEMSANGELFSAFKQQTDRLRPVLTDLARQFPEPTADLGPPLLATARDRRERDLAKLLSGIDPKAAKPALPGEKASARGIRPVLRRPPRAGEGFPDSQRAADAQ